MLEKLCNIQSPASYEEKIINFIIKETEDYITSYYVDNFGNLVLKIDGQGDEKIIECGIDEPFLMACHYEDGKQFFTAPPHFKAKDFLDKEIVSTEGTKVKVLNNSEDEEYGFSDLYAETETEFGKLFSICSGFCETEDKVFAENITYKIPVYVVISAIKELKDCSRNITFLFSVHKNLAARGVKAFFSLDRCGSVLSVSCSKEDDYIKCGKGAIVCVKEKSAFVSQKIKKNLIEIAEKENIDFIPAIISENLNLRAFITSGSGAESGLLCVPYNDKKEILKNDIKKLIKLVISYCKQ